MAQGNAHRQLGLELQEKWVRAIVREEIVNALGALGREASHQDMPYETGELESAALSAIGKVAEGAVQRLICPHETYSAWHGVSRCSRCGEPEPPPGNPFEEQAPAGRTRECPVDLACPPLVGWSAFCAHVYEVHTEGDEESRIKMTDRLLKQGRTAP